MRFVVSACVAALSLSACRSAPTASFDARAADFINKQGSTAINGHAFYRGETGKVVYAAGEYVYLIPVTTYAEQRFAQVYGKGKYVQVKYMPWGDADPEFKKFMRSTKAESTGKFKFEKVAPGDYYVATSVTWTPEDSILAKGAAIYERVTITGQEKDDVQVIVSGK